MSPHLLRIDASYTYRTYLGCLEGIPKPKSVMASAKRQAIALWGERPMLMLEPPIKNGHLPTWVHMVWASGPAKNDDQDGSELVIIWWSELTPDTERVLSAVNWEKHAKDFQF